MRLGLLLLLASALWMTPAHAKKSRKPASTPKVSASNPLEVFQLENRSERTPNDEAAIAYLTSGNQETDIAHFHSLKRHLGFDVGMMIPLGDFQTQFASSPLLGLHLDWEAIDPFRFHLSIARSSSGQKDLATLSKLSVTTVGMGATAAFTVGRAQPFVKMEGGFYFNDIAFNDGRLITAGNDLFLTTLGFTLGLGVDFIVGRELSIGFEALYHYCIPKKLNLNDGSTFDLGSPFATVGLRVNF